jgi:predicted Ser/Thr protein kinase
MTEWPISRYRLEEKLGEGGMGVVYRAVDLRLGRMVAVKVLHRRSASDALLRNRLVAEARAASILNHPAIATLYDCETEGDLAFLVYEYVQGKTIRKLQDERSWQLVELLSIITSIAEGIAAAHDNGIVHRDLKPENVMITNDGRVKILDFGLAKFGKSSFGEVTAATAATAPGLLLGTLAYMSPEQLEGEAVDHRADVFALGTMFYELAAKKHPFKGKSPSSTIGNILKEEPRELSEYIPAIPADVRRTIRKCMRKRPEERYQSMRELIVDLDEARRELTSPDAKSDRIAGAASDFAIPADLARFMFLLAQAGYLLLYGVAMYHVEAIGTTLSRDFLLPAVPAVTGTIILAMCGVAVRLYLVSAVGWRHPAAWRQFERLFPAVLVLDSIWAASPLLLAQSIRYGVALSCVAVLVYMPFAQRTLLKSACQPSRIR